jgi:hypothetical protein
LVSLLLAGCGTGERVLDQFDGPVDVAFLPPGPFFEVPVAFVTNFRSGRVGKIDLKRAEPLVEDSAAPWMPGPDLALGREYSLGEIALAVTDQTVDVWVADDFDGLLLRVPYITGLDSAGDPIWNRPSLGELRSFDKDGVESSAALAEFRGLRLQSGRATTERWTFTWTGNSFEVRGDSSGLQQLVAVPGTPYSTDHDELSFTPSLGGEMPGLGAYLELDVASGIESAPAGGLVTDLLASEDGDWIFASVIPDQGPGYVAVWDAESFIEIEEARVVLPDGGAPERLAAGKDQGVLWVADSADVDGGGRVLRLDYSPGDPSSLTMSALPVPEPAFEIAEGRDPDVSLLFVAAAYSDAVWAIHPSTAAVFDTNPVTPEDDPTHLRTIIAGMTAGLRPVETNELDLDGTRHSVYGVFATTFGGELYFIDAGTGCQVFGTPARAYADFSSSGSVSGLFNDVGFASDPQVVYDAAGEAVLSTHPCGGVTRTEVWTLRYSEALQSYAVEGSRSGEQLARLFEGDRYISDRGEISLLILPGTQPTTDGDSWSFSVNDGVTPIALQELPGDPLIYTELYDDRSGDWFEVKEREVAVIPHVANDVLLWIDLQGQGAGGVRAIQ